MKFFSTLALVVLLSPGLAASQVLKVNKIEGDKEQLIYDILNLALSKSAPSVLIQQSNQTFNEGRLVEEVLNGTIDVMWAGSSKDKEDKLTPIRIPILKGILGHRLLIIRHGDQAKFSQIDSLENLQNLKAGQGQFWGDTQVLKRANIPTVTAIKYANLFPMLEGGRFDYFPRALHEPWIEVKEHASLNLIIDKHLMLIYPFAMYFYVNPNNPALHDKIYQGFEQAITDGSFDSLFFSNPMIKTVLEQANLQQRTVIHISNPLMHPDTPFNRSEFWLDIDKI